MDPQDTQTEQVSLRYICAANIPPLLFVPSRSRQGIFIITKVYLSSWSRSNSQSGRIFLLLLLILATTHLPNTSSQTQVSECLHKKLKPCPWHSNVSSSSAKTKYLVSTISWVSAKPPTNLHKCFTWARSADKGILCCVSSINQNVIPLMRIGRWRWGGGKRSPKRAPRKLNEN